MPRGGGPAYAPVSPDDDAASRAGDAVDAESSPSTTRTDDQPMERSDQGGTFIGAVLNLMISAAGAGLLSFPYAFREEGVLAAFLVTAVCALGNVWTVRILFTFTQVYRKRLTMHTYEELMHVVLGKHVFRFAAFIIVFSIVGGLIGFFIVLGDLSVSAAQHLWGSESLFSSRGFLVTAFAAAIVFPLSFFDDIHSLKCSSALSWASVLSAAAVIVYVGGRTAVEDAGAPIEAFASGPGILLGVPLAIFSLGCHLQTVPVASTVRESVRPRLGTAVAVSTGSCFVLYLTTGIFGFVAFGGGVCGDVFRNLPDDGLAAVAKALMAVHIALASPVLIFPARRCLAYLLQLRGARASRPAAVAQALAVIAPSALLAVLVPEIAVVFGLIGATASTAQIYVLPGMLLYAAATETAGLAAHRTPGPLSSGGTGPHQPGEARGGERALAPPTSGSPLISAGPFAGAAKAPASTFPALVEPCCTRHGYRIDPHGRLRLSSKLRGRTKAQGVLLIVFGCAAAAACTAVIVWQDFLAASSQTACKATPS